MARYAELTPPEHPRLAANIALFARALRRAGLPIGPGRILDAVHAVEAAGFTERADFYWTLHACFVSRPEHRATFNQTFRLFWRDPRYLEHMMAAMLPAIRGVAEERIAQAAEKRAAEALLDGQGPDPEVRTPEADEAEEIRIDAARTASTEERLRSLDFEQMSTDEAAAAARMIARLALPVPPLRSRRATPGSRGRIDAARTLRAAMRHGGEIRLPARRQPRTRWPDLVVLCDISGSMSHYSRMVLHFVHAVAHREGQGWARVHAFTFGTRLTNISRHMTARDVDAALASAGAEAQDWEGGTRIGDSLHAFNRDWSRRVMSRGAVVLLVTDGLDRGDPAALAHEAERLRLSARRVIWLNPLLRFDGFAPLARGVRALLPHVDSFRSAHSVASLEGLAATLSRPDDPGERARMLAALAEG